MIYVSCVSCVSCVSTAGCRRLRTKAVLLSLADGDLQGLERAAPDYLHRHGIAYAVPCEQTL